MNGELAMRLRTVTVIVITLALVFLLGFGTNEIVRARRVIIGDNQVVIGQDAFGGYLIIRDIRGNVVFSVQGGEVRMPTGDVQLSAMPDVGRPGDKIAQLIDVRPYVVDPTVRDEIRELIAEAVELEGKAGEMKQEAGTLRDKEKRSRAIYGWRWDHHRHDYFRYIVGHTDGINNANLRGELRDGALKLNKAAKSNRGKAKRMQRAIAVSRQVVTAWNGSRRIVLISKGDIGNALSKVPAYGFFVWTGGAAHPDDIGFLESDAEHYEVRTVKGTSRPEGWQDAP